MTQAVSHLLLLGLMASCLPGCAPAVSTSPAPAPARAPSAVEAGPCPPPLWPALGVVDAKVDAETAQRFLDWRRAREEERFLEQIDPNRVRAGQRLSQEDLERGCFDLDTVVDLGRQLFLRDFTKEEGHGHDEGLYRFQRGRFGGPDATSCQSCHWKGGEVGAGDRVDNAYLYGDGDDVSTADVRNPAPLWGAGWLELVAAEMSAELLEQADALLLEAEESDGRVERTLFAKGVAFGTLAAESSADGPRLDTSGVQGVDGDLRVKPFGWKGTYSTLREIVGASLQLHLGLQAEEVVAAPEAFGVEVGDGPLHDPDGDGVEREISEGQVSALVLYLATQDAPPFLAPEEGAFRSYELYSNELEFISSPEYAATWSEGYAIFQQIGCASCHTPYLTLDDSRYRTKPAGSSRELVVNLGTDGAQPVPPQDEQGRYLVAAFTDFKRHDLGEGLQSLYEDRGVPRQQWLTRPLWGLSQSSPYLHTGSAMVHDYAITRHGGEASESRLAFLQLRPADKEKLRFFLASLARAPRIRVR